MKTGILIIVMNAYNAGVSGGVSVDHVEFDSMAACRLALNSLVSTERRNNFNNYELKISGGHSTKGSMYQLTGTYTCVEKS